MPPSSSIEEKQTYFLKLGHKLTFLGKLNFKPTLEQVTPSRSSVKSLGADLPPLPSVLKGPNCAGSNRVNFYLALYSVFIFK